MTADGIKELIKDSWPVPLIESMCVVDGSVVVMCPQGATIVGQLIWMFKHDAFVTIQAVDHSQVPGDASPQLKIILEPL